ncbi:ubiquinone/menaquinone biosynthesis C-methylase UbiE [Cytobacillus purgationiresistens]|uniref:Ubiquinone/menaquinone biosynthesis C-methylase UbiE n=1 Tax=Cytobacillus purgationiresistens TaxID=863449 RepID=A0ABU0ALZ0_9BACI|nr:ubiquinone/menaquinone biosynthesis C-methylase UbiE [Cytobacillus purgationiresistens]
MPSSIKGGAGEWQVLKALISELDNKHVLDLRCGFGWHCRYAREQETGKVIGVDISDKMLQVARGKTHGPQISYMRMPIEDIEIENDQLM